MYNGDFICKKEIEHNGIIPLIYKRIICVLWKGHNYIPVSLEEFLNVNTVKNNVYCKKLPDKCIKALDKWVDNLNEEEKMKHESE